MSDENTLETIKHLVKQQGDRLDIMEEMLRLLLARNILTEFEPAPSEPLPEHAVHIFFNCDDAKSAGSMNVRYNNQAYGDDLNGRKKLMERITEEMVNHRIYIKAEDMQSVTNAVLAGTPEDAGKYIKYGAIVTVDVCGEEDAERR